MSQPTHQRPVYQLHIIRCGILRVKTAGEVLLLVACVSLFVFRLFVWKNVIASHETAADGQWLPLNFGQNLTKIQIIAPPPPKKGDAI